MRAQVQAFVSASPLLTHRRFGRHAVTAHPKLHVFPAQIVFRRAVICCEDAGSTVKKPDEEITEVESEPQDSDSDHSIKDGNDGNEEIAASGEPKLQNGSGDGDDDGSDGNEGGGDGSGGSDGFGDDGKGDGGSGDDSGRPKNGVVLAFQNATNNVQSSAASVKDAISSASSAIASWAQAVVSTVPAPVLVAIISLISTVFGARYRAVRDANDAAKKRAEAARKRKMEIERELRRTYELYAAPLLKSASKLAERLWFIVNADWSSVEQTDGTMNLSPIYSTYLLGRFFAHVEILKNERALLDYGFPTADRILANILGRVQGVLCANDETLRHIQNTEHFYKPAPGEQPLKAGPLKISPRKQTALGELMLRKVWKGKYNIDVEKGGEELNRGAKAVLSFLEFVHIFKNDDRMRWWYDDVVDEFSALERYIHGKKKGNKRSNHVGARIFILQSTLVDVVEFFDPNPHPQSIPNRHRVRLQLGPNTYKEEVRSPASLRKLYREIAQFREHREHSDDRISRLALPDGVEVFVTGKYHAGDPRMEMSEHGNCPHSHRVLIALREMGIPYHTIPILPDNKPAWFYLLNPLTQTPVIYYKGDVVSDSSNILAYITDAFPNSRKLSSSDHLKLAVGPSAFIRFHSHFSKWLKGQEKEKDLLELELRNLECTLRQAQEKNNGAPFLGGESFSREDTAIAPCLHVVEIGGRTMKGWRIPKDCVSVYKYLKAAREMPSFQDTGAKEDAVICRLKAIQGIEEELGARLADMLE